MEKSRRHQSAIYLRNFSRYALLVMGILVFIFALLSGSESFGGGIIGILKNSPNAVPWLTLLLFLLIAWRWQLLGGILILSLGIFLFVFFTTPGSGFHWPPHTGFGYTRSIWSNAHIELVDPIKGEII